MQITFHDMRYQLLSALISSHEAEGEQRAAEAHVGANALATFNYALYAGELGCPPIRNAESIQVRAPDSRVRVQTPGLKPLNRAAWP
jgi:hypothetical protein